MSRDIYSPQPSTPTERTKLLQNTILEMYRDKPNFLAISRELNLSVAYVRKMYQNALKAIISPEVEQQRKIENERLDKLHAEAMRVLQAFHPVVNNGAVVRDIVEDENGDPIINHRTGEVKTVRLNNQEAVLKAIDRLIRISERRSRLWGLDAPTKTAFTDPTGEEERFVQFYIPQNNRDSEES